jgi:hypothetical protein
LVDQGSELVRRAEEVFSPAKDNGIFDRRYLFSEEQGGRLSGFSLSVEIKPYFGGRIGEQSA